MAQGARPSFTSHAIAALEGKEALRSPTDLVKPAVFCVGLNRGFSTMASVRDPLIPEMACAAVSGLL